MTDNKPKKRCLVLSQGPVPTPEQTKVEGGGLRCWGLAKGILANNSDIEVTVAYHESYTKPNHTDTYEGIKVATWEKDRLAELISGYDTIVVSYCMSDLSVITAATVRPDQQLVLDCYVPIYVEVSARQSDDQDGEYYAFHNELGRWGEVLRRGDIFLCASETQKKFYRGVLSGLGRINPATYGEDTILVVPYGIYEDEPVPTEKPITKLLGNTRKDAKKILWFGGIYPWFDLRTLVDAVQLVNEHVPAELIIVGAKNPFNNHPDFVRSYEDLVEYVEADKDRSEHVIFQDWVQFDKRADWYLDSDLVVVINKLGEENELAWRTRLVDFLWADLPIITNGGDPLGEILLSHNAALRFSGLSAQSLGEDLAKALENTKALASVRANLSEVKKQFYWSVVTKELAADIAKHKKAVDLEKYGYYSIGHVTPTGGNSKLARVKSAAAKARMIPAYARKHGTTNTYYALRTKVNNRLRGVTGTQRSKPGIVMIAHQLDFSGAPYVFMDLAESIVEQTRSVPIEFHTFNPALKENFSRLNKIGIKPRLHISRDIAIPYINGDVVVLNTVAHSSVLKHSLYGGLEVGKLKRLLWFIHEDEPELIFSKGEIELLKKLLAKNKVIMYIAAQKTLKNYQNLFENTDNIRLQPYKYVIPEQFQKVREEGDFDKLSFILPGTMGDGRKGQLPVFYAFTEFYRNYFKANPKAYRDFELVYVGVGDDFMSRQILNHKALLGERFKHHDRVTHEQSSALMMRSNMTICYSLRECLPLFVFEGMAAGHPILRNDSSGIDEQLFEGKNGFYLDSHNYEQVVNALEQVLNKSTTTNQQLAAMSAYSNKVALAQAQHSYKPMVDEILGSLG